MKSLYLTLERQRFIVKSEQLLAKKGVNLACPVTTSKGELHMLYNQYPYVLYEWIDGESAKLRDYNDLESIIQSMAEFHYVSSSLSYPSDITIYEHNHWMNEYNSRLKSIEMWETAHKKTKNKNEAVVRNFIPFFKKMAKKALNELKLSKYDDYVNGVYSKSLVHGDFHNNNVIILKNDNVIIDFEDVRFDLPSKDLLRIYSLYINNHRFHSRAFLNMMKTYEYDHPLSPDVRQLVYIDLLFPHSFERLLRKKKYVHMKYKKLKHWIKQEKKKANYIYHYYFNKIEMKNGRNDSE